MSDPNPADLEARLRAAEERIKQLEHGHDEWRTLAHRAAERAATAEADAERSAASYQDLGCVSHDEHEQIDGALGISPEADRPRTVEHTLAAITSLRERAATLEREFTAMRKERDEWQDRVECRHPHSGQRECSEAEPCASHAEEALRAQVARLEERAQKAEAEVVSERKRLMDAWHAATKRADAFQAELVQAEADRDEANLRRGETVAMCEHLRSEVSALQAQVRGLTDALRWAVASAASALRVEGAGKEPQ